MTALEEKLAHYKTRSSDTEQEKQTEPREWPALRSLDGEDSMALN